MEILEWTNEHRDYLVGLRREFHQHPEPSLEEHWTAARIEAELDALGIPHRRVGETGVLGALLGEGAGEGTVVLRADIDALRIQDEKGEPYASACQGLMHACGHDAHAAALLGAVRYLAENRAAFGGEIRLFFQQAEEIGQGARIFVKEGLMEGVGRVFGVHMASDIPVGKVALYDGPSNASCDYFKITLRGRAAHVSTPHKGVDALYIASQIVVALQAIAARQTSPLDSVIVGVGRLAAGTAYNIVAEHAELEGTTRSFTPELRSRVNAQVEEIALSTARMLGAQAEIQWGDYAAPLINSPAVSAELRELAGELLGPGAVTGRALSLGADDFADLTAAAPGAYAYVGSGNPDRPNTVLPHHNGRFDIDERALETACALYAGCALRWLGGQEGMPAADCQ